MTDKRSGTKIQAIAFADRKKGDAQKQNEEACRRTANDRALEVTHSTGIFGVAAFDLNAQFWMKGLRSNRFHDLLSAFVAL